MPTAPQTVLCAAISGDLHECVELLREIAESRGGSVLRTMTDRVLAVFATPDAAAGAAAGMLEAIDALPAFTGTKLGVRIAFLSGPIPDLLRLVAQAKNGQILTNRATAEVLGTSFRAFSRQLHATALGDGALAGIYEISRHAI